MSDPLRRGDYFDVVMGEVVECEGKPEAEIRQRVLNWLGLSSVLHAIDRKIANSEALLREYGTTLHETANSMLREALMKAQSHEVQPRHLELKRVPGSLTDFVTPEW